MFRSADFSACKRQVRAAGELDEIMKKGTKRATAAAGASTRSDAAPVAKRRQLRNRGNTDRADDALAAAGLEDDEEDVRPAAAKRHRKRLDGM